ncbi:unnamed protein product, partial [Laminaria digitata]
KEELQARLSKTMKAATCAQERDAAALSEAQKAAHVAVCEANSLRVELDALRSRSEEQTTELSLAVEDARSRASRATKGTKEELEGLRRALRGAEARKEKALQ